MTEDELSKVTVGALQPVNGPIALSDYDPRWPELYLVEAESIRAALGERVFLLEHCGSTSVPGLCAKPIVDIVLAVADSSDEPPYVPPLEAAGFTLRIREPGWFEHRMFKSPRVEMNLHVFSKGCEEIARMLAFRDRLRAHPADRDAYAGAKRELAAREWKYVQDYADAKSGIVKTILARVS